MSGIKNFWRTIKSYLPNKGNFSNKIIISEKDCIISKEGRLSEKGGCQFKFHSVSENEARKVILNMDEKKRRT